jgi:negative regulator of sigma E activity
MQTTQTHPLSATSENTPNVAKHQTVDRMVLISAYFDGEFEQSDLESLSNASSIGADIDPLEHREDWAIYALIADSLAHPSAQVLGPSVEFTARLSAALQREPAHQVAFETAQDRAATPLSNSSTSPRAWSRWFSWPSLAMAAAVAAVVWVAQPLLMLNDDLVVVATPTVATETPLDGEIVSDYANAHRQFSGPIAVRQATFEPEAER